MERSAETEASVCICWEPGATCVGVPGDNDPDDPASCEACLALDPEAFCLRDPEVNEEDDDD